VSFVLVVLAFEGVVRLAGVAVPALAPLHASSSLQIRDPDLRRRGNPRHPDHDEAGWRNASRPDRVDVVALGDSQTWGTEVARELAWPQVVERLSQRRVYNMSQPGYGPWQYARLLAEARDLSPDLVVVAVYFGNDVYDAYRDAYEDGLSSDLASADAALRARMRQLDREAPLRAEWRRTQAAYRGPVKSGLRASTDWLHANVAVYGAIEATIASFGPATPPFETAVRRDFARYTRRAAEGEPGLLEPFEDGSLSTVFTPRARLPALDPSDPRIEDGLRILVALLRRMRDSAPPAQLAVLLVPTKELVYAEHATSRGARLHDSHVRLVAAETDLRQRLTAALDARGVPWIDALPELRAALSEQHPPYEMDWNGHPNAEGNAAIARSLLRSEVFAARAAPGPRGHAATTVHPGSAARPDGPRRSFRTAALRYDERRSQPAPDPSRVKCPSASASRVPLAWQVARTSTRRRCSRAIEAMKHSSSNSGVGCRTSTVIFVSGPETPRSRLASDSTSAKIDETTPGCAVPAEPWNASRSRTRPTTRSPSSRTSTGGASGL
jgi:lysophospholipase L1-like esterase